MVQSIKSNQTVVFRGTDLHEHKLLFEIDTTYKQIRSQEISDIFDQFPTAFVREVRREPNKVAITA